MYKINNIIALYKIKKLWYRLFIFISFLEKLEFIQRQTKYLYLIKIHTEIS